jgi:4-hydroxybenzoate polyprenyltransferase
LLRPQQWIKNVFVFAGLVFGQRLLDPHALVLVLLGFACLCVISSSVYVVNDIHDREEDRLHPRKRLRPLASGRASVRGAALLAAALVTVGLSGAWLLDRAFFIVVVTYLVLQLLYTFAFKHMVLLDVIAIGAGFVLRAIAGVVLIHVTLSPWLVLCTFTLCLFMGFSKRRCELNALAENGGGDAARHRRTLSIYTKDLLNHMTTLTAGIAVVSFMLYATDARTKAAFGTDYLLYTLPMVVYAIFRFAILVEHGRVDGPTDVLLRDRPFQVDLLLWTVSAVVVVYAGQDIRNWFDSLRPAG